MSHPLEPSRVEMRAIGEAALAYVTEHISTLPEQPSWDLDGAEDVARTLREPPPEDGAPFPEILSRIADAVPKSLNTAAQGYLAYIPGGGLFTSAIADLIADATNRYVGMAFPSPALAQIEASVVSWLCGTFGYPPEARGILTSGGSLSNLSAIVAARHARLGEDLTGGTIYVQEHTHHSVAKAAVIAGIAEAGIRTVPCTPDLRMDERALSEMVARDRAAGRRPFAVVATLGTTNTGAIDPLPEICDLAEREGLWVHADAAYGGFFQLTERGRRAFTGVERADSVTLDPHKGMFLPYGTGALICRDGTALRAAHTPGAGSRAYLQDILAHEEIPSFAEYSPELSRDFRGLRVWLPLRLHGVRAFREALDEKLDLARVVYEAMAAEPGFEVPWEPALSIVAFRYLPRAGDPNAFNRALLDEINASRRVFLSSTVIDGRFTLRVCVLSHRTHRDRIDEAVEIIRTSARRLDDKGR